MRRSKWMLPVGIVSAVIVAAFAVVMVRASADDMLYNAARWMEQIDSAHAVLEFDVETPEESGTGTVEVWGRWDSESEEPPVFRIEVIESSMEKAAGAMLISDGTQFWMVRPDEMTVLTGTAEELKARMQEQYSGMEQGEFNHDEFDPDAYAEADMPETPEEMVDKLLEYFTAERAGSESVGQYDANKLRLIPIPEQIPEEMRANGGLLNVWLRVGDDAPLGIEYTGGAVGYARVQATTLDLNAALDDALFTYTIPDGYEVVNVADLEAPPAVTLEEAQALAEFEVLTPDTLPVPARMVDITEVRGAVVQRYNSPDGSFTVAQGPATAAPTTPDDAQTVTVRGVDGVLVTNDDDTRSLVSWTEGDVTFWVGGDLSADDALAVAESLK